MREYLSLKCLNVSHAYNNCPQSFFEGDSIYTANTGSDVVVKPGVR